MNTCKKTSTVKTSKCITVAITGIYGSGKSTVAKFFNQEGVPVISSDEIVGELLKDSLVAKRITKALGKSILDSNNSINKKKLADIIFTDKRSKKILEGILHPLVLDIIKKNIFDLSCRNSIIMIEVPLLFETKSENLFDFIITVSACRSSIKERLNSVPSLNIEKRWEHQLPLEEKEIKSDYVINNSHTFEVTSEQVKKVMMDLVKRS